MRLCVMIYMGLFLSVIFLFLTVMIGMPFIVFFASFFGITMFHLGEHAVAYRVTRAHEEDDGS